MSQLHKISTHNSSIFKILSAVILISLPILGIYYGYSIGKSESAALDSSDNITVNKPKKKENKILMYENEAKKNKNVMINTDERSLSLVLPDGWDIKQTDEKTEIVKENSSLTLTPFFRDGANLCIFAGETEYNDTSIDGDSHYPKFSKYSAIQTSQYSLRRGKINGKVTEEGDITKEIVCVEAEQGRFADYGSFYTYPMSNNPKMLQEMDDIVESLIVYYPTGL